MRNVTSEAQKKTMMVSSVSTESMHHSLGNQKQSRPAAVGKGHLKKQSRHAHLKDTPSSQDEQPHRPKKTAQPNLVVHEQNYHHRNECMGMNAAVTTQNFIENVHDDTHSSVVMDFDEQHQSDMSHAAYIVSSPRGATKRKKRKRQEVFDEYADQPLTHYDEYDPNVHAIPTDDHLHDVSRPLKKSKKPRKVKDPLQPKKPPSGYAMFVSFLKNQPDSNAKREAGALVKRAGLLWHAMTVEEKAPFHLLAAEAKERHQIDTEIYNQQKAAREQAAIQSNHFLNHH
jgi:hypothetical protein